MVDPPTIVSVYFIVAGLVAVLGLRMLRKPRYARDFLLSPRYFDWKTQQPVQHKPFLCPSPAMGLSRINESDWLMIDCNVAETLAARAQYLQRWGDARLLIENKDSTDAIHELWTTTTEFMAHKYPQYKLINSKFINTINGTQAPRDPQSMSNTQILHHLSLMIEEDFILLRSGPNEYTVEAANHVHPTGFNPQHILGKRLSELHAPVPGYDRLRGPMTRFFDKLKCGQTLQRLNWSCQQGKVLCLPDSDSLVVGQIKNRAGGGAAAEMHAFDLDNMYLRVERQTFKRLPRSQYVAFTVRTYLYNLKDLKRIGQGHVLADAVEALDHYFGQYKGRPMWGDAVVDFLRAS